jgi:hypothetical protein
MSSDTQKQPMFTDRELVVLNEVLSAPHPDRFTDSVASATGRFRKPSGKLFSSSSSGMVLPRFL